MGLLDVLLSAEKVSLILFSIQCCTEVYVTYVSCGRNLSFVLIFFSLKKNYLNESYNLQIFQLKRILQHTRLKEKGDGRKKRTKNN
jgi:hypothetical protein